MLSPIFPASSQESSFLCCTPTKATDLSAFTPCNPFFQHEPPGVLDRLGIADSLGIFLFWLFVMYQAYNQREYRIPFIARLQLGNSDRYNGRSGEAGAAARSVLQKLTFPIHCPQSSYQENNDVFLKTTVAPTVGAFLILFTRTSAFAAGDGACSLLTQTQVSSALGVSVGVGQHPSDEMHLPPPDPAIDRLACTWYEPGKNSLIAKRVSLNILRTIGSLTPVQQFNNAKTPIHGITKTTVTGGGDDAFYMVSQLRVTLHVKKGNSVFEMMVGGFSAQQLEQVKTMEKTLAQDAVAKL